MIFQIAGNFLSARFALALALLFVGSLGFYACSNKKTTDEVVPVSNVRNDKNQSSSQTYAELLANDADFRNGVVSLQNLAQQSNDYLNGLTQAQRIQNRASYDANPTEENFILLLGFNAHDYHTMNNSFRIATDRLGATYSLSNDDLEQIVPDAMLMSFPDPWFIHTVGCLITFGTTKNRVGGRWQSNQISQQTHNDLLAKAESDFWDCVYSFFN
jgi:hypothetical protein